MKKNTKLLLPLTSLRFFAAGAIVLLHALDYDYGLPLWLKQVDLNQAVSFFFILSGFILSYVYAEVPRSEYGKFFLVRFARLWPAHLFTLLLVIILVPRRLTNAVHEAPLLLVPFSQLLMMHAWIPLKQFYASLNSVSWSISTEFFFYLFFPFLRSQTVRRLAAFLLLSLVVTLTLAVAGEGMQLPPTPSDAQPLSLLGLLYVSPVCRILEFMAGMLAFRLFQRLPEARFSLAGTRWELVTLGLLFFGMWFSLLAYGWLRSSHPGLAMASQKYLVTAPFFVLFIMCMAKGKGLLSRLLSNPALVLLGEVSYAMYLLHLPLLWAFQKHPPPFWLYGLVLVAGSYAIWRWIEKPLRQMMVTHGSNWLDRRSNESMASSTTVLPVTREVAP